MKKITWLIMFCLVTHLVRGQDLYMDKLINELYFSSIIQSADGKHQIAFIVNDQIKDIIKSSKIEYSNFALRIFKSDSCFISYLKIKKECELLNLIIKHQSVSRDTLKASIAYSSTNFESYTDPRGKFLEIIDEREIFLVLDKRKNVWKYIKPKMNER